MGTQIEPTAPTVGIGWFPRQRGGKSTGRAGTVPGALTFAVAATAPSVIGFLR